MSTLTWSDSFVPHQPQRAEHMAALGFDPATGRAEKPVADAAPITGYGASSCSG